MAHEILSVKLCQLDDDLGRLHSRIRLSESAGHDQLCSEIQTLRQECDQSALALGDKLRLSKSEYASVLYSYYKKMEELICDGCSRLQALAGRQPEEDSPAEAKLLLAEYALDFAHQAANRALLISLDAIDTQRLSQDEPERKEI